MDFTAKGRVVSTLAPKSEKGTRGCALSNLNFDTLRVRFSAEVHYKASGHFDPPASFLTSQLVES